MASELFRFDLPSTPIRRRASVLPVSIAAHIAIIGAFLTAPLFGDIEFPPPNRPLNYAYTSIELPMPPPVALTPPTPRQAQTTSPTKAPLDAPPEIKPESLAEFSSSTREDGADPDGAPFGIDGGVGPPVAALPPPPPAPVERRPMKVGGQIQAPRRIVSVAPIYPPHAQAARIDGTVEIESLIGEDGKVRNATVVKGRPLLNEAALNAVRQWVFTPTRLNGEPVAVIMTVTVVFSLN